MNEPTTDDRPTFDDPLGSHLAALSEPGNEPATIWREALTKSHGASKPRVDRSSGKRLLTWNSRTLPVAAILLFVVSVMILPQLGKPRGTAHSKVGMDYAANETMSEKSKPETQFAMGAARDSKPAASFAALPPPPPPDPSALSITPDAATRQVIRKATIELATKDVPTAFAKTSLLINESLGEFIERSSLRGRTPFDTSEIVLRVSASRLGSVLTQLREFGTVTSESAGGDDVTDRVVDLEARLRNERRIESELLKLLDSRPNSPLEDVLKLRAELSRVRLGIEQLDGQKQQLSRAVSLATVLVLIRADGVSVQPTPPNAGLGEYFNRTMSKSWTSGVKGLADSVSMFLENLLAGLVWWILLLIVGVFGIALLKRAYRAAASEPAPRL